MKNDTKNTSILSTFEKIKNSRAAKILVTGTLALGMIYVAGAFFNALAYAVHGLKRFVAAF